MQKIKTSDGVEFEVERVVLYESKTLKNLFETTTENEVIELNNIIRGVVFEKIIDFCKKSIENRKDTKTPQENGSCFKFLSRKLEDWETKFCADCEIKLILEILGVASYLEMEQLIEVGTVYTGRTLKNKNSMEIKKLFGVENDFTKEEYEEAERYFGKLFSDEKK